MADDQVTAALEEIRHRRDVAARMPVLSDRQARVLNRDVPVLLAAIDGVLARHVPAPSIRLVPCEEHRRWRGALVGDNDNLAVRRACPVCQVFDEPYCRACVDDEGRFQDWPCVEYRAISSALLGSQTAQAGKPHA